MSGKVIPEACLAGVSIIDRVTFSAHIIETRIESHRLRIARQRRTGGRVGRAW